MLQGVVREGDRVVWEKEKFVPGVEGIASASTGLEDATMPAPLGKAIVFEVGSGRYSFKLTTR